MRIYLDHAATTPVHPEVAVQVARDLCGGLGSAEHGSPSWGPERDQRRHPGDTAAWANPAALHATGRQSAGALAEARARVAAVLDADPHEVLFTSGGTESCALVVTGRVLTARTENSPGCLPRVLISAIEHPAVLDTARTAATQLGAEAMELPVGADGVLDLPALEATLCSSPTRTSATASSLPTRSPNRTPASPVPPAALVSVMLANNETGALQPVSEVARLAHDAPGGPVPVHTDAVAAVGRIPVSFRNLGVDALSLSGHKVGAPVGVGALVVRRDLALAPPTGGGGQERGLRSGTQDVVAARALALALELAQANRETEARRLDALRARLLARATALPGVHATLPDAVGHLPGTVHLWCEDADGEALLMALDLAGIDASAGSACHAGVQQPSHVALAMGLGESAARATLRVSMGRTTTAADVEGLLAALPGALDTSRRARAARR